jgi:ABC-type dipeptide/oligopeptide/nickel transport system permease component
MQRFLLQRLLLILLVSVTIVFAVRLGIDFMNRSQEFEPELSAQETLAASARASGLFLRNLLSGDLGEYQTPSGPQPLGAMLRPAFVASMGLMLVSMLVSAGVGVYLGTATALGRSKLFAFGMLTLTVVGISAPSFFIGMLLQQSVINYFVATGTRVLSVAGYGWNYRHLLLPVLVLSARPIAYLMRTSHITLDRTMQEDYIRTAYSKGLRRRYVINVHALANVAVPVLTAIGVSLRFSLGVLPVVEYLFAWPGMGLRLMEGIRNGEPNAVMALSLVFGLIFLVGNLLLDVAYRYIDPRMREGMSLG